MTMNLPPIIKHRRFSLTCWAGALALVLALAFAAGPAEAQLQPWNSGNEFYVDLTVLEGGARRRATPFAAPSGTSTFARPNPLGLMEPPSRRPSSRLLVRRQPGGSVRSTEQLLPAVKLRQPGTAAKKTRRTRRRASTQPIQKPPSRPKVIARKAEPPARKPAKPARALTPTPAKPAASKAAPSLKKVAKAAPPKKPDIAPPPAAVRPKPAAAPSAVPKPQRQASLPKPAAKPVALGSSSVAFAAGEADLDAAGKTRLDAMANQLNAQAKIRMQLLAYAGGKKLSASKARRLSLSRALAIRSYLIGKGVRSTRIDVRALGNKVPAGRPDRVDLKIIQR
jgi:outer membrane protein OmpA-like peptidoglycan-associated protein